MPLIKSRKLFPLFEPGGEEASFLPGHLAPKLENSGTRTPRVPTSYADCLPVCLFPRFVGTVGNGGKKYKAPYFVTQNLYFVLIHFSPHAALQTLQYDTTELVLSLIERWSWVHSLLVSSLSAWWRHLQSDPYNIAFSAQGTNNENIKNIFYTALYPLCLTEVLKTRIWGVPQAGRPLL